MVPLNFIVFVTLVLLATCSSMPSDLDNVIRVPEPCKGMQYCPYKPEGYEKFEEKINIILRQFLKEDNSTRFTRSIRNEEIQLFQDKNLPSVLSPKSDWHNCPYETKKVPLYLTDYLDRDQEVALIVQTKELHQVFDVVTCAKEYIPDGDGQCFQDLPIMKLGMKSTCEEIYAKRNVYVYNVKKRKIYVKYISFPVACTCKVSYKP